MSYLLACFGEAASPDGKDPHAISLTQIEHLQHVSEPKPQTLLFFTGDIKKLYVDATVTYLAKRFADAQKNGENVDLSRVTQITPFSANAATRGIDAP